MILICVFGQMCERTEEDKNNRDNEKHVEDGKKLKDKAKEGITVILKPHLNFHLDSLLHWILTFLPIVVK